MKAICIFGDDTVGITIGREYEVFVPKEEQCINETMLIVKENDHHDENVFYMKSRFEVKDGIIQNQ